ncbi:MAG: 6,7-dimethyl-8-ribityllumazine synthase [Phycisphaerae bacterium]|nr:6,7-dimethyl-8-ribityllumazine synthase [Phycisphaerae bacterium]
MIEEIQGRLTAGKGKYAIVVSRFNDFITSKLLEGAIDCLRRHGAADEQMCVARVPGACEITIVAKKLAETGRYVAVLCLGAVIRGQTGHYDAVCQQVVRGVGQINYDTAVPTVFGVLTCDTLEQAIERAGTKMGNAGADAAMTAMEMAHVMEQVK